MYNRHWKRHCVKKENAMGTHMRVAHKHYRTIRFAKVFYTIITAMCFKRRTEAKRTKCALQIDGHEWERELKNRQTNKPKGKFVWSNQKEKLMNEMKNEKSYDDPMKIHAIEVRQKAQPKLINTLSRSVNTRMREKSIERRCICTQP